MTLEEASKEAKYLSNRFNTFWYVREVKVGQFQPYAHDSGDLRTVAMFYCGNEIDMEQTC